MPITQAVQTARDLRILAKSSLADAQKILSNTSKKLDDKISGIISEIKEVDAILEQLRRQREYTIAIKMPADTVLVEAEIETTETYKTQLMSTKLTLESQRDVAAASAEQIAFEKAASAASKVTATPAAAFGASTQAAGTLQYNASMVSEAYFSSRTSFLNRMGIAGNKPSAISTVQNLWNSGKANKGMIVTAAATLEAWNSGSQSPTSAAKFGNHNYGFQFSYNPGTVSMTYYTSPNIDVTLMTSGQDLFNLAGTSGSQGSVSFQVILNRVFDMQYYDSSGNLKPEYRSNYAKAPATSQDEKDLYNKGTMYDVEYLLRTLMGTTMSSYLRGTNTADMGWLPAMPVELHLGKSLKYLGTVNSINLNHIIFNEKMVPLFTTMDISFARLPDYPSTEGLIA